MNTKNNQNAAHLPLAGGKGLLTPTVKQKATGEFVMIEGEKYYEIKNYDSMLPFFISIASDSNHWMYIASTGGLSAGRKNPDQALFPYYTDDKISESADITGSKTIMHVTKAGYTYLWEPFSERNNAVYQLERSILKSSIGNKLIFIERNLDLGLTFKYAWMNADDFGWIKKSQLLNDGNDTVAVYTLDGLQNVLPSGIDKFTQNTFSTLVDGYKKAELIANSALALYRMEAILVDRAEPSESLRANSIWSTGLENASYLLSSTQLSAVRNGQKAIAENEAKGVRGAYFVSADLSLEANESKTWYFVAEVNQDVASVNNLLDFIEKTPNLIAVIEDNVAKGSSTLQQIVAQADGVQYTADENNVARHFSNVLFNTMRGGIYSDNYTIEAANFNQHIKHFNAVVYLKHADFLVNLPKQITYSELDKLVSTQNDANLQRLFQKYLPLTFSRRHGDPSRPWNLFNINVKDEDGKKLLGYQGNWRDIFQNWEALSLSYPQYINAIIAKFLNATTTDGYNPYKVTDKGIDWEVIEPENPWSNIGYWGDHQIIYLLKLMEVSRKHYPERLLSWLNVEMFAFANVPYRLKSYADIVANPKDSIRFDQQMHHAIEQLEKTFGADARLLLDANNEVKLVTFTEKLLATLLAKLSNFVPEAGIWMNTLRPEWNDANNALVGSGASMVTLYYIRRFVAFAQSLYADSKQNSFVVSTEMHSFFDAIFTALKAFESNAMTGFSNKERRAICDKLGMAGENYRNAVYAGYSGTKKSISKTELDAFFSEVLMFVDQSIAINKRADNMYHAYNLVSFTKDEVSVRNLYEMLEGQVAVLTSGKLNAQETLDLLDSLRSSALYRADQNSYILYPNKTLPLFVDKNNIPASEIKRISLLQKLVESGNSSIITSDNKGQFHFNASFNDADFLHKALIKLRNETDFNVSDDDVNAIEAVYEQIFDHQSFTGRSGTFYKYEGLGCIYWHMVSKLLLAIGENIQKAIDENVDAEIITKLKLHYNAVKDGIGAHKSPAEYGSFPFDPYSHTPMMAGVQQPGMTGQVKEDILNQFFELGVRVQDGCIEIKPEYINLNDFIRSNDIAEVPHLSFTYCSIQFVYLLEKENKIVVNYKHNESVSIEGLKLTKEISLEIFNRYDEIENIEIYLSK